jgi:glucose-1-phosphate thymidylyltransferase
MISIAGKPIIHYVLESLAAHGIRDIVMVVGYKKEQIFDYAGDGKQFGVEIKYITQEKQRAPRMPWSRQQVSVR